MWFVVTGLKCENPLILNAFELLQIVSGVSMAYNNTSELPRGHECMLCVGKIWSKRSRFILSFFSLFLFFTLSFCLHLISLFLCLPLYLYQSLSISISGYVNDLMCGQRRHLCEANVRRHQSFHHNGEPQRPKDSLKRRFSGY